MRNLKNTKVSKSIWWRTATCGLATAFSLFIVASGCDSEEAVSTIASESADIIGGYNATSDALNHTGVLLADTGGDVFEPFCSGTLIDDEAVVTAKHCGEIAFWGYDIYFGIGPDGYDPIETIQVAGVEFAPLDYGGFTGYGEDVSILHLDHPPVTPVSPVTPSGSEGLVVGVPMVSIGYGVYGASGAFDGQRRIGRETVAATEGLTLEAMFGDFESFVEWWFTGTTSDEDWLEIMAGNPELEYIAEIYESEILLEGDEAVTGVAPNDTQSCNGDSGGPLMAYQVGTGWVTYGVVSGGLYSNRMSCDYGTVFATFGPDVIDFIDEALTWEDPCGDVTATGACEDNVAMNCSTDVEEGTRELTSQDCSATGQICVLWGGGSACGTIPEDDGAPNPEAANIGNEIRQAISDAFFYDQNRS